MTNNSNNYHKQQKIIKTEHRRGHCFSVLCEQLDLYNLSTGKPPRAVCKDSPKSVCQQD